LAALGAEVRFELDANGRVLRLDPLPSAPAGWPTLPPAAPAGATPQERLWELPGLRVSQATRDALRAALDQQQDFADLVLGWAPTGQRLRHVSASGLARRDADGRYLGHHGVISGLSGEARFHDLFRRIPTALVVHRQGQVLDANPAAVALFGQPDLHSLLQADLLSLHASGGWQARTLAHWQALEPLATGAALPACELRLRGLCTDDLIVQVSSVRIDTDNGAATLSIYQDDTERHHADQALQRSEALLSHLVDSSPDVIALTELATGRYAMVNASFTRLTGYEAHEAIGKTSLDLNIWTSLSERQHLVEKLSRDAAVQNIPALFNDRHGHALPMLMSAARFSMDGRAYLVISARDISATEQARLEREAILANAVMGIAVTRERRFTMVNPRFEQMFGWPLDTLTGQAGLVIWPSGHLNKTTPSWARWWARAWPRATRLISSARSSAATAARFCAASWPRRWTCAGRCRAAPSGWPRTSPSADRSSRPWPRPGTRPKPPTAPRVPSWPAPAMRSARRSTPCWAWPTWPANPRSSRPTASATSNRSATAPRPCRPS
jgi:PAS domain S-box-containing protein